MGLFSKFVKGPQPDMEKSEANAKKMRQLFDQASVDSILALFMAARQRSAT